MKSNSSTDGPLSIEGADNEESVTALLHLLLEDEYERADSHPAVLRLRSILSSSGQFSVPVLDLAAVLPDVETRELRGLHIACYEKREADPEWYLALLEKFFTTGGRGSLLALTHFNQWVGQYAIQYSSSATCPAAKTMPDYAVKSMRFSPAPKSVKYPVRKRFGEYADRLLASVGGAAAVVWICFGPREDASLQWGGSVFAILQPNAGSDLHSPVLNAAIGQVYAVLSAAFHRTIVDSIQAKQAEHHLQLTYFTFGHDLKNRLDRAGIKELRDKIRDANPVLLPDVDECYERLQVLAGICGVFSAVAKSKKGRLPAEWIASIDGPGAPTYVPSADDGRALIETLADAVATFVYVEDPGHRLTLRCVQGEVATPIGRPTFYQAIQLPQFSRDTAEPHLCFLSGLAELCRNAARAVLDADLTDPHIDFSVDVSKDFVATVTIYNPVSGNDDLWHSNSIALLAELFEHFNEVVKLHPAHLVEYDLGLASDRYVQSQFVYSPLKLRFEEVV